MSDTPNSLDEEQVKPPDVQALKIYTRVDDVEPEYQHLLDEMNKRFKDIPHYLESTVQFTDPAIAILLTNHTMGKCRLGHTDHQLEACMQAQMDRWFQRMEDIGTQNKLEMPTRQSLDDIFTEALPILVNRARRLVEAYERDGSSEDREQRKAAALAEQAQRDEEISADAIAQKIQANSAE